MDGYGLCLFMLSALGTGQGAGLHYWYACTLQPDQLSGTSSLYNEHKHFVPVPFASLASWLDDCVQDLRYFSPEATLLWIPAFGQFTQSTQTVLLE